ncbi:MAG: 16S rRNA (cytidine(1402)-2'-O)-methyltransferase [Pseudomonadota bacterium]
MARPNRSKRAAGAEAPPQETAAHAAKDAAKDEAAAEAPAPLAPGLHVAATPIGAAGDVTLRALDALARADVIAAEDTRRALKLMAIHGVPRRGRPVVAYHDHNGPAQRPGLLRRMAAGESVVYVSDAGTPLIADPGWRLAREAIDAGIDVVALPGASALLAALAVSGLPTDRFLFAGFLPPKAAARRRELAALAPTPATLVFYESPRRLAALLADMAEVLGPDRAAAVSRELTKRHEETRRGPLRDLAEAFAGPAPKGEIVVCVGPRVAGAEGEADLDEALLEAMADASLSDAAKRVATTLGLPRKAVYARALALDAAKTSGEEGVNEQSAKTD